MIASATKNDGDVLISLERAGEMLGGISKKSVCRRIAGGVLPPPVKEGKFSRLFRSDVIRVIQEMKEERDKKYGVRNSGEEAQERQAFSVSWTFSPDTAGKI